jgi:hypothetical protein
MSKSVRQCARRHKENLVKVIQNKWEWVYRPRKLNLTLRQIEWD